MNGASLALVFVVLMPSLAVAESEVGGSMVDRRWDLVAAALFGLAVSFVGLRRWGHAPAASASLTRPLNGPSSTGRSEFEATGISGAAPGLAKSRERRRARRALGEPTGSAVLKLDAGQIDALTARYGAEGAASILAAIETRARRHLRGEHDRLVTLGRGEMVIMLEDLVSPLDDAEMIAKRLSIDARRPVDHKGVLLFPTLSIGIAHSKVPGDIERLLAEADRALQETWGQDRIAVNDTGSITTA